MQVQRSAGLVRVLGGVLVVALGLGATSVGCTAAVSPGVRASASAPAPSAVDAGELLDARELDDAALAEASAAGDSETVETDAADASPSQDGSEEPPTATWSTPAMVQALARDCAFRPWNGPDEGESNELSCTFEIEQQSCAAGTCNDRVNTPCRRRCAQSCTRCDTQCRASCTQCRARCTDDACRARCATSCAGCLQGCLDAKDQCQSGTCGRLFTRCDRAEGVGFQRQCARVCRRCTERCEARDEGPGACVSRCARRGGCSADQAGFCAFEGPRFGWHYLHPEAEDE